MGNIDAGETITITCKRDAANPNPILVLKKDGTVKAESNSDTIAYIDIETDQTNNHMNYTCEATGGEIVGVMNSPMLSIPLLCMLWIVIIYNTKHNRVCHMTSSIITVENR